MVLSGSSGNIDISHCPVFCSTTFDLALRTHSGWLRSGTNHAKNRKATTTIMRPRPRPKRKPSVRSSAPTRLSSTMSEMRAVMIETTRSVPRKTPPAVTAAATVSLLKYCFAVGSRREYEYSVTKAATPQAPIDRISRMKPRIMASSPEINMTASRMMSSSVIGIGCSGAPRAQAFAVAPGVGPARRIRASHSGSGQGRQCRP